MNTDLSVEELLISNTGADEEQTYSPRCAIWKLIDGRWQMVFHKGTRSEET
jgi:hypothetical protein